MPQKQKILLIEDDNAIREMYKLKFELAGLDVKIAEDGLEGLKIARKFKPDLLLIDLKIPNIGGEDVLEKLQKQTVWGRHMKVMVMTNINKNVAPKKIHELRVDKYLVKAHFTPGQILKEVKAMLKEMEQSR